MMFVVIFAMCFLTVSATASWKTLLRSALEDCILFKRNGGDNETLYVLFNHKIKDLSDIHYYIYGDHVIKECIGGLVDDLKLLYL
jgi:hypothetical protein